MLNINSISKILKGKDKGANLIALGITLIVSGGYIASLEPFNVRISASLILTTLGIITFAYGLAIYMGSPWITPSFIMSKNQFVA